MVKIAYEGKVTHPEASRAIIDQRYVDDIAATSDNEMKLVRKVMKLMNFSESLVLKLKSGIATVI